MEFMIYLSVFRLLICLSFNSVHSRINIHIFPGAYIEPKRDVIAYESSVPLVYDVSLGDILENSFLFTPPNKTSCPWTPEICNRHGYGPKVEKNACTSSRSKLCNLTNSMDSIFDATQRMILDNINRDTYKPTDPRERRALLNFIGDFYSFCCGVATESELHEVHYNAAKVTDHLNNIQQLVHTDHQDLLIISNKSEEIAVKTRDSLMKTKETLDEITKQFEKFPNIEESFIMFSLIKFYHSSYFIYSVAYQNRINSGKTDCIQQKLPKSFVNQTTFKTDLKKLSANLANKNLELAIPIQDVEKYYKFPLTKCNFFQNKILISVRIPLRRINVNYELFHYRPTPLLWDQHICTITSNSFALANSSFGVQTISEDENCNLTKKKLCLIPRFISDATITRNCAKKILEGASLPALHNQCKFTCNSRSNQTHITPVSMSKFLLADVQANTSVICNSTEIIHLPEGLTGVLEVNIPCNCEVHQGTMTLIRKNLPCDSRFPNLTEIKHLIPHTWANLTQFQKMDIVNIFSLPPVSNLENVINKKWNLTFPSLIIEDKISPDVFEKVELPRSWYDIVHTESFTKLLIYSWLAFLTLINLFILYKIKLINVKVKARVETVTLRRVE